MASEIRIGLAVAIPTDLAGAYTKAADAEKIITTAKAALEKLGVSPIMTNGTVNPRAPKAPAKVQQVRELIAAPGRVLEAHAAQTELTDAVAAAGGDPGGPKAPSDAELAAIAKGTAPVPELQPWQQQATAAGFGGVSATKE